MAKEDKVAKKKGAKPGVARTKVSRLDKALRRLNGTSAKTPFSMKTGVFTVTGFKEVPEEIAGYLLGRTDTHTYFRHKKTNASKQMVVSVFANAEVLALLGDEKGAALTVNRRKAFISVEGTLKFDGPTVIVTGENGELAKFNVANGDYEIKAVDAEGSQASTRGRASSDKKEGKKDGKKSKVVDIKDGGKKKSKK